MLIPQYTKCFGCVPLIKGLLGWGYVKVLIPAVTFVVLVSGAYDTGPLWFTALLLASMAIDAIFNIVLVIGCHMRSTKLLRVAYAYSGFAFIALAILALVIFGFIVSMLVNCHGCFPTELLYTGALVVTVIDLLLQLYFILLVRSGIIIVSNENKMRTHYRGKETEDNINGDKSEKSAQDYVPPAIICD